MENKETNELAIWLRTFVIFVFAIASSLFFLVFLNRNAIFNKAAGGSGSLAFSSRTIDARAGQAFSTQLWIGTDEMPIKGTDVRIKFDRSRLELVQVTPLAQGATSLKTFLPLQGAAFDGQRVVNEANATGFIEFSAITADLQTQQATAPFKGQAVLAQFTFRSIQPGDTTLKIVHDHPSQDSTVIEAMNPPANILSTVNDLVVHADAGIPAATPAGK